MLTSIVIPFFNRWDLTHQCLFDVFKNVSKTDVEIILVDDCSTEQSVLGGVQWWQNLTGGHTIRYHRHDKNKGFGESMNDGCKLADGDIVVLLSNDVRVSGDFIPPIRGILQDTPKTLLGNEFLNQPTGWNEFEIEGKKGYIPYVNGWFIACTKDAWKELGGFDKLFGSFDYEDVDLSVKALTLGYNLKGLDLPFLRHLGGQTVYPLYPNRQEYTTKNRQLFISKWGNKIAEVMCST